MSDTLPAASLLATSFPSCFVAAAADDVASVLELVEKAALFTELFFQETRTPLVFYYLCFGS